MNDGDHESSVDPDKDHPEDEDADSRFHENTRYQDADDSSLVTYGQAAGHIDEERVTAVVKRYFRFAATGNGAGACAELVPRLAKRVAGDYGGEDGPSPLRGSKSCGEVLQRMFKHSAIDFSAPIAVTNVRVEGAEGIALLGSRRARPSFVELELAQGAWHVARLLPEKVP